MPVVLAVVVVDMLGVRVRGAMCSMATADEQLIEVSGPDFDAEAEEGGVAGCRGCKAEIERCHSLCRPRIAYRQASI
jgi:hypothetical protein